MTPPPASVIVVSRHRAAALMRCIVALTQQDHPNFELIVVADPEAIRQANAVNLALKCVVFDEANISAARNAGLGVAAAPVVAFIDDDAVAEPTWLLRLTAPFADLNVIAATGFIRGRNGISFQWKACLVDALGQDHPLDITSTTLLGGTSERAVKTIGTNCAFRRDTLLSVGGFDPSYRFYLDEADVNLRMARLGLTAVVPMAQVHHGYAESERRRADRVPLTLHDIAASSAIFLRRHAPQTDLVTALADLTKREAARAQHHLVAGRIGADEVTALMTSLHAGWAEGLQHALQPMTALPHVSASFAPIPNTGPRGGKVIAGRVWQRNRLSRQAEAAVSEGKIVTVICLSPSIHAHRMQFQTAGYWAQTGGLFGRSLREGHRIRLIGFRRRIAQEIARIAGLRPTD